MTRERDRRLAATCRSIGEEIRRQREDAGISQRRLAGAAGVDQSYLAKIEGGTTRPSIETLTAVSLALGSDLAVRFYPHTGPSLRDRTQAMMLEALLRMTHRRWRRFVEVQVQRPSRGVIDLVLHEPDQPAVAALEAQSQMRRLEQQVRWAHAKAESLANSSLAAVLWPDTMARDASSVLLLRSSRANRDLAVRFEQILQAAYPARMADAVASLASAEGRWPGSVVLWSHVAHGTARLLDGPPRGVRLGR